MIKSSIFILCTLLVLTACSDDKPVKQVRNRTIVTATSDTEGTAGDWYMRLNGTLAGKPIVAHLHKYGSRVSGYYQYTGIGTPIRLDDFEDSTKDDAYYLRERASADQSDGADCHWLVRLKPDGISGTWIDRDGHTTHPLELQEGYPQGSIGLSAFAYADTAQMWKSRPLPTADVSYGIVWPEGKDKSAAAAFAKSEIAGAMALEASVGPYTALKTRAWRYFSNYRLDLAKVLDSNAKKEELGSFAYHYTSTFYHYVVYNDHNWLILESAISNYTGGAHGIYGYTYINLDLAGTRLWKLNDIITDTAALAPLLADAARGHFKLGRQEPLDKRLLVSDIPATYNFYLSPGGLSFVYNPYDIASYADGVITLFIPYDKLMPLMSAEFKTRAELAASSGAL